ncbi:MAG: nucleoside-diphosphate sugar epimerase/dehydratase [Xanthobacteraceae bacterium]
MISKFPFLNRLAGLTSRNLLIAIHDVLATGAAVVGSFLLRFNLEALHDRLPLFLTILPPFLLFSVVVCFVFDLTTTKWRFISFPDVINIVRAATVLAAALLVLDYVLIAPRAYGGFFFGKVTIILYWFLQIFFFAGLRFAYRYFRFIRSRNKARAGDVAPALLIGLAADAEIFLRGFESGATKHLWPVGILSPSRADRGQLIRGIPILGAPEDLKDVVDDFARRGKPIRRLVMTPSAFETGAGPGSIIVQARRLDLIVSQLPSLETGETPHLRPVAVEDLLLRPTVKIDHARLDSFVRGKSVVVTGGGGSIGAEICDRVVAFGAARLLIIENSEPALYGVMEGLRIRERADAIEGRIADIRDFDRILQLMNDFKPDIVFHAAALKHVPILERDWSEGVKTNVLGSINVADAAIASGVETMVMISTDKAIEPVSMLGLTKRFAEMYCQAQDRRLVEEAAGRPRTRLISVRFGNVLASRGSVVPKFKAQIEAGGPLTVTHPDMIRYFMTIREACNLVIAAASHAARAANPDVSVYVLNMGQPIRIVDLAERMIQLSGLQPGRDIEIVFTGIRPGERLNEILFGSDESTEDVGVAGVLAARPTQMAMTMLQERIAALKQAIANDDRVAIRAALLDAMPDGDRRSA